jgi:dual-specificity kinase
VLSFHFTDKIQSKMGEGTFGQVLECWDRERKEMVAIKIIRGIKKYRDAAMIEIDVLQQLGKYDTDGSRYVPYYLHSYLS